jgi:hypothetical protein
MFSRFSGRRGLVRRTGAKKGISSIHAVKGADGIHAVKGDADGTRTLLARHLQRAPNYPLQQTAALLSVSQGIVPSRPPLLSFGVRRLRRAWSVAAV